MAIFKKVIKFFEKNFWLFLVLIVLISYGQLLFMQPWEDDNALFFKLANIEGGAGFLGKGPFGEGAYMYTATPYIPIYTFFGHNIAFYFAFAIIFYFLATLSVYKTFSWILGKRSGQIAGFLYAAGYMAADGFIRLFNTIITSISVIGISFLTYFYWRFHQEKKLNWYFLTLLTFFLVNELARTRTHYLIVIVIFFELLFFLKGKNVLVSIRNLLLRLAPFLYIFYRYFVVGADARSDNIKTFLSGLLRGEFYRLYGWLSALSNIIIPDYFLKILFKLQFVFVTSFSIYIPFVSFLSLSVFIISAHLLLRGERRRKVFTIGFTIILAVWFFISKQIFATPVLNVEGQQIFVAFLGGALLLLSSLVTLIIPTRFKALFILFWIWVIVNIGAYSAYSPTVAYDSMHRYLAHSFFAFIGILAIFVAFLPNGLQGLSKLTFVLIILWGLGNLVSGVVYQKNVVEVRSNPVKKFYQSLKGYLPKIGKGDVLYFDVKDDARGYFRDAFSVAQMPEETAIAWRYGVDRYDIRRTTSFEDLVKLINEGSFTDKEKNKIPLNKTYTFFYSADGLVDTTRDTAELLSNGAKEEAVFNGKLENKDELTISLTKPIKAIVPTKLKITLSALPLDPKELDFPYIRNAQMASNSVAKRDEHRRLAFSYKKTLEKLSQEISVTTSNDWRDDVAQNLIDQNPETIWRAHRVLWPTQGAVFTLDLKEVIDIDRLVWVNAFGSNTPVEYKIQTSIDGASWQEAKEIFNLGRVDTKEPQAISFSPRRARFARMAITKTLNSDSPGIAEAWVVPTTFSNLDVREMEGFLNDPFSYVPSKESYENSLSDLNFKGRVQVYWKGDKDNTWTTKVGRVVDVLYDSVSRQYQVILPAGGTKIDSLKLVGMEIPGQLTLTEITARPLSIRELTI